MGKEIFVDFDHTLFDTDFFFWTDIRQMLINYGINSEQILETYFSIFTGGYTLEAHLKLMGQDQSQIQGIMQEFKSRFSNSRNYLFPDAIEFLEAIRSRKDTSLALLSFGNPEWQRFKVEASGISNYFDALIFTDKENSKADEIRARHKQSNTIYVVDNSPQELDRIKESIGDVETFLLAPRLPADFFLLRTLLDNKLFFESRRYVAMSPRYLHKRVFSLKEIVYIIQHQAL